MDTTARWLAAPALSAALIASTPLFAIAPYAFAAQPVTLDMLPKVTLTRPAPVQSGGSFILHGTAQASAGLASAEAYIDNRPLFNRTISGNALDIGTLGINVPITGGAHTIRFMVRDRAGRVMQDAFQTHALPPQAAPPSGTAMIHFDPPRERAGAHALIAGTVSSANGLQQIDLTLRFMNTIVGAEKRVVNGTTVDLKQFHWRPNLPGAGAYTMTIDVLDRNLAKTTKVFAFNIGH